ncbi:MAG TPA: tryptophan 7-halogenase [Streptosporangiaceae bacterium]|nr:tryptophan 7-halogenase [Streptosporangiaceae bacterium]
MKTQVAIVGGGPGGSAAAIHLAKQGIESVIIEREKFPRFHIGESLTGGSGDLLREMGLEEAMMARYHPVKYGIWIFGPSGRANWWVPIRTRTPQGQRDTFSWQVRRSDFDTFLLDTAIERGTTVLAGRATAPIVTADGAVTGVHVEMPDGSGLDVQSDVLVDASGQKTFLSNAGLTGPKSRGRYSRQIAIYSHFTGVLRDDGDQWGNTLTFLRQKHHWCWFIPLDSEVTSIGFVVPGDYYQSCGESPEEFVTRELREFHPELIRRVAAARRVEDVHATSNYSYEISDFTGRGWLCVGDAHRFVDPLFSFGVNITIQEAREAACSIRRYLNGETAGQPRPFADFEELAGRGTSTAQLMLDGFWDTTFAFGFLLRKYEEDFVDLFAGRMWGEHEYPAISAMRETLAQHYAWHPEDAPEAAHAASLTSDGSRAAQGGHR